MNLGLTLGGPVFASMHETLASNPSTVKEMLKYRKVQFHQNDGGRALQCCSCAVAVSVRDLPGKGTPNYRWLTHAFPSGSSSSFRQGSGHSCFETGSHCVALTGLEFSTQTKLAFNSTTTSSL